MLRHSGLHVANLSNLLWMRSVCIAQPEAARCVFSIDEEQILLYARLSDDQIDTLCAELDVALLIPRFDGAALAGALRNTLSGPVPSPRSDLALNNLRNLERLCEACRESTGHAVWTFRISRDTADTYAALQSDQLVGLSQALGTSAFIPRYLPAQLTRILDRPSGLRPLYAAACESEITTDSPAARRSHFLTH